MKIFSNFDTKLSIRLLDEAAKKYGQDLVLLVRRGKVYLLIKLFLPIILWLFLSFTLLWPYYRFIRHKSSFSREIGLLLWAVIIFMTLFFLLFALKKIMNYYMDFVIITPDQLVSYDQEGVLTRTTRSLELRKIKTVNVVTDGWLSTVFGYGSIVFLAEGDNQNGDIRLNFIIEPVHLRNIIYKLIENRANMKDDDVTKQGLEKQRDEDDEND